MRHPRQIIEILNFGFLYRSEFESLVGLAARVPLDGLVVNVGAGAGTSGVALYLGAPFAARYTVDFCESGPLGSLEGERNAFAKIQVPPPVQILGDSRTVAKDWKYGPIDFIFIDDGHLEHEIRGDIEGWLPHVKPGGIAAFHDYSAETWPAVKKVVDEYFPYKPLVLEKTLVAFQVKEND
jgi:predicted O-methyltransferase YrrM